MNKFKKTLEEQIKEGMDNIYCPVCKKERLKKTEIRYDDENGDPEFRDQLYCEKCRYVKFTIFPTHN